MAVLAPKALDQLRRLCTRRGKLLAQSLARRRRERIDLAGGRPPSPEPVESFIHVFD
jgi:hypothetical protein